MEGIHQAHQLEFCVAQENMTSVYRFLEKQEKNGCPQTTTVCFDVTGQKRVLPFLPEGPRDRLLDSSLQQLLDAQSIRWRNGSLVFLEAV